MSYKSLLKHRCSLLELQESFVNGIPQSSWVSVAEGVKCFLDLNYIRRGKDPMWTAEAGRVSDRTGVLFLHGTAPAKSGMRVKMTFGPAGTFLIEGAVDQSWRPTSLHHLEVGVIEVPSQISKGQEAK